MGRAAETGDSIVGLTPHRTRAPPTCTLSLTSCTDTGQVLSATSQRVEREGWCGSASLRFHRSSDGRTVHQGGCRAPLKLSRAFANGNTCELSLLHTAGGLVGGDVLRVDCHLETGTRVLLTGVAAQKVYGSVGRSRLHPRGRWARQSFSAQIQDGASLCWLPQETVLFPDALLEQRQLVQLMGTASYLGADIVRLGPVQDSGSGGGPLGQGCWRSRLELQRNHRILLVDPTALDNAAISRSHGMAGHTVVGTLLWTAAGPLHPDALPACLQARAGLAGEMEAGMIHDNDGDLLCCRYRGPSTQAARFWFTRIWALTHQWRGLPPPRLPRVWPFQESPLSLS